MDIYNLIGLIYNFGDVNSNGNGNFKLFNFSKHVAISYYALPLGSNKVPSPNKLNGLWTEWDARNLFFCSSFYFVFSYSIGAIKVVTVFKTFFFMLYSFLKSSIFTFLSFYNMEFFNKSYL